MRPIIQAMLFALAEAARPVRRSRRALVMLFVGAALMTGWVGTSAACEAGLCVASYEPMNGYAPGSCCYVANGPGRYVAVLNAGGFEIYVDGEIAVWGWGGTDSVGTFPAKPGQTVTIVAQCDRGVYCAAAGAFGAVVGGDPL